MAVRFDASSDGLSSTSAVIDHNAAYTVLLWFYLVSDPSGTRRVIWTANQNTAAWYDYLYVVNSSGIKIGIEAWLNVSGTAVLSSSTISTGTWYCVAVVRESTSSLKLYFGVLGGGLTLQATNTQSVASRSAATREELGAWTTSNSNALGVPGGRIFAYKEWQTDLSLAELNQEAQRIAPVRFANLFRWTPLWPGDWTGDYSGNGRSWTADGTLTDEDNPPIGWGAMTASVLRDDGPDYTQDIDGAMTPAGALVRQANKQAAGGITPVGALARQATKKPAGGLTPVGVMHLTLSRILAGAIEPTGTMLRVTIKQPGGAIEPAGALVKQAQKVLAGSMASGGSLLSQAQKTLAGSITPTGQAIKETVKILIGGLTPAAAIQASRTYFQIVAGSLTPAGVLVRQTAIMLAGALQPVGVGLATLIPQVRQIKRVVGAFLLRVGLRGSTRRGSG